MYMLSESANSKCNICMSIESCVLAVTHTCFCFQFNQFMLVIREMLKAVEVEQQSHLEQLSKMEEQTK